MKRCLLTVAAVALAVTGWVRLVETHERVNTTVSFDKEIVRIVTRKCLMCHSENNLSVPFTTYEETRPWARAIEEEVLRRHMPPWRAQPGYGQFANDIGLTSRELAFLVGWVEGNGPKTKGQTLVVNLDQGETDKEDQLEIDFERWQLGTPDLLKTLQAHTVPAGQSEVRRVVVDPGLTSERWVRALEFKPGDRRVVRAVFFTVEGTGQWLGSWTPWHGISTLPQNVAYRLPAGTRIVAEIHSRGAGQPVNDEGRLGLYFAEKPAANTPIDLVIPTSAASNGSQPMKKFSGSLRLTSDLNLIAFKPANEAGLDSVEVTTRRADGTVRVLLLVRGAMPEWPTPYILKEPLPIPRDTELRVTYYYNASATPSAAPTLTASVYAGKAPILTTK